MINLPMSKMRCDERTTKASLLGTVQRRLLFSLIFPLQQTVPPSIVVFYLWNDTVDRSVDHTDGAAEERTRDDIVRLNRQCCPYVPLSCSRKVTIATAVCSLRARGYLAKESRTETVALLYSDLSN